MPRGGARVGAGRKPKQAQDVVQSQMVTQDGDEKLLPLEYMLRVIRDPETDAGRRDRMAVAAAPYLHPKMGEGGKKHAEKAGVEKAKDGRYAQAGAPRMVVNNK